MSNDSQQNTSTSEVNVKDVLNTHETGKSPENVNKQPVNSGDSEPKEGGTSDVSAKEQLNTHGSGEPSADNVDVQTDSQAAN